MARARITSLAAAPLWMAAFSLLTLAVTGCDSGTQEPDAPEPEAIELGAPPMPEPAEAPSASPPTDGSIAAERFPAQLPEGGAAEIPTNFPSNVPVYPGATPALGMGGEVDGSQRAGVQLLSNDSTADVFAYYESQLKANGWEISETNNTGAAASLTATQGNAQMALFVTSSPDGGSDIFVISQQ